MFVDAHPSSTVFGGPGISNTGCALNPCNQSHVLSGASAAPVGKYGAMEVFADNRGVNAAVSIFCSL